MGSGSTKIGIIGGTHVGKLAGVAFGEGTASTSGNDKAQACSDVSVRNVQITVRQNNGYGFWVKRSDPSITSLYNIEIANNEVRAASGITGVVALKVDSPTNGLDYLRSSVGTGVTTVANNEIPYAQNVSTPAGGWNQLSLSPFLHIRTGATSSVVPIYKVGDVIMDTSPVAGGSAFFQCTGSSAGVPTDNTGDTTDTSYTITGMADTSDMTVGYLYTISAGFPSATDPYTMIAKTATTATFDTAATSSVANVTVTEIVPTWSTINSTPGTLQAAGAGAGTLLSGNANALSITGWLEILNGKWVPYVTDPTP
jgi:hypothetical protein